MGLTAAVVVGLFLLFLMPLDRAAAKGGTRRHRRGRGARALQRPLGLEAPPSPTAEVGLAIAAFAGVLVFGVVGGIAVAIGLSIGVFLYRVGEAARCRPRQGRGRRRVPRHRALGGRSRRVPA